MNFNTTNNEENEGINIAPLIDVVFLLLIFFMLTTTFKVNSKLEINLPQSSSKEETSKKQNIEVSVNIKNQIFINNKLSTLEDVEKIISKNKTNSFLISADKKANHGKVVELLNLANKYQIKDIGIATELTQETK